jgi:hypothetical protein
VLLAVAQPEDERADGDRHGDRAAHVEPSRPVTGHLGQHPPRGRKQHRDERDVHEEDRPPAEVLRQHAARDDPADAARRGRRRPQAERPGPRGPVGVDRREHRDDRRRHERRAHALHEARGDEHPRRRGEAAGDRRRPEHPQPREQQPAPSEHVPEPAAQEQQRPERQGVARHDPLQAGGAEAELARDRPEGDVDDAEVELEDELRDAEQQQRRRRSGGQLAPDGRGMVDRPR